MPETKPSQQPKLIGLTRRQQIEKSGKTIFIWVAVAGVVVSLSLVLAQFLVRQGILNQKVISQKQETSKRLDANLTNAEGLKRNVDALLANTSLSNLRVRPEDSVLQVIPDALPSTGDPVSFSNSLYNKILQRSGAVISDVVVGAPGAEVVAVAPAGSAAASTAPAGSISAPIAIPYNFTATGSLQQIMQALTDLDKSTRPIVVNQIKVTSGGGGLLIVVVTGETYYLPSVNVQLGKTPVKP